MRRHENVFLSKHGGNWNLILKFENSMQNLILKMCCTLNYFDLWEESLDETSVLNSVNLYFVPKYEIKQGLIFKRTI